jgi:RNA polymerase-binding protein DksA
MDEFEEKIKRKLEEMRADILSKIKILPHISKEEMADITDFTSVEKIRNIENISISIHTDILKLIERALDKIQNGNYGYCEICGDKIDKERLEEVPYTRYCIDCQEKIEFDKRISKIKYEIYDEEIYFQMLLHALEGEDIEDGGYRIFVSGEQPEERVELEEEEEEEDRERKEEKARRKFVEGKEFLFKGSYDKAIECFTQAIKLAPYDAYFYGWRGLAYYGKGEYDKAIEDFTQAIKLDPYDAYFYGWRGLAHYGKGEYDKAIEDFTQAGGAPSYYWRGLAYLRKGLYNKAIQDFTRAIDLNPTKDKFYQQRGLAYLGKGLYEKAIEDFSKAIELYPHNPEYYRSRGIAYELMGLYDKAREDFKKAMELE